MSNPKSPAVFTTKKTGENPNIRRLMNLKVDEMQTNRAALGLGENDPTPSDMRAHPMHEIGWIARKVAVGCDVVIDDRVAFITNGENGSEIVKERGVIAFSERLPNKLIAHKETPDGMNFFVGEYNKILKKFHGADNLVARQELLQKIVDLKRQNTPSLVNLQQMYLESVVKDPDSAATRDLGRFLGPNMPYLDVETGKAYFPVPDVCPGKVAVIEIAVKHNNATNSNELEFAGISSERMITMEEYAEKVWVDPQMV